jgi:hypothetical protein
MRLLNLTILYAVFFIATNTQAYTLDISFITSNYAGYNISCHGASDGSINVIVDGGWPPYSFSWSNSATTQDISSLPAGIYVLTITDDMGYQTIDSVELIEPNEIFVDLWIALEISAYGASDGRIETEVSGGNPSYSYQWANDPNYYYSYQKYLPAGKYIVTVTDANNCQITDSINLTQPDNPPLAISFSQSNYSGTNISCNGYSDGQIYTEVTGGYPPYTFSWSNGVTTPENTYIPAGNYILTITDYLNNTIIDSVALSEPNLLQVSFSTTQFNIYNISIHGGQNGQISTTVTGGTFPYSYLWSTNSISSGLMSVSAGTYILTVTDDNNCQIIDSIIMTEPPPLQVISMNSPLHYGYNITCFGGTDGSIDLTVAGGIPPYRYVWAHDTRNIEDISDLYADIYTVFVYDSAGAVTWDDVTLTQPPIIMGVELTRSMYPNNYSVSCYQCYNGSITTNVTNGFSPLTYLWSTGQTTADIDSITEGAYSVLVTDSHGCTASKETYLGMAPPEDWAMSGNAGSYPTDQFIGTKDSTDFVFRTNNIERLRILGNGNLRISGLSGTATRLLRVDGSGNVTPGEPVDIGGTYAGLCDATSRLTLAWYRTNTIGPWNDPDLINCTQRFGFGVIYPQERVHILGNARFTSTALQTDYLNIGHGNGNSHINSYGNGELLINEDSPQNVKINPGVTGGNVSTGGNTYLALDHGNVGIGTSSPSSNCSLDVNGNVSFLHTGQNNFQIMSGSNPQSRGIRLDDEQDGNFDFFISNYQSGSYCFKVNDPNVGVINKLMTIYGDGGVAIGEGHDNDNALPSGYKLAVNGSIIAEEVTVKLKIDWPDFVFNSDYDLRSLDELKNFINANSHLPDLPSSYEISKSGLPIGEVVAKQMQKIEELTLYILDLQKQIDELKAQK